MIGCEVLPLQGMFRSRGDVLTPPQSSPESHIISNNIHDSHIKMQPLDHPSLEVALPHNIPDILYCKFSKCILFKIENLFIKKKI